MLKKWLLSYWTWIVSLAGLLLVAYTVYAIGWSSVAQSWRHLGWQRLVLLTALYGIFQICFCFAWRCTLNVQTGPGFFKYLLRAYLAGDALNMTVPSANLAGEPVKVMLLKDKIAPADLIASVTVYKMVDFFSMTLFLLAGLIVQLLFCPLPRLWVMGGWIVACGMALGCLFLFLLQKKGFFMPLMQFLQRFKHTRVWAQKLNLLYQSDAAIRVFLQNYPQRFLLAVLVHFLAWAGGAVEIFIFLKWVGVDADFKVALVIETFSLFLNNVAFFVPGRLGVLEGGRTALFGACALGAPIGLAYSLARRLREVAWIAAGFLILLFKQK